MTTIVRVGAALGLRSGIAPAMVYVPVGYLLGPAVLNVLSPGVLGHLDFVLWLALATLGVFAGCGLEVRNGSDRRLLFAASIEAAVSAGTAGLAFAWLLARWGIDAANPVAPLWLVLGVCAAASAVVVVGLDAGHDADAADRRMARIADLDDVAVIVVGGFALAAGPASFGSGPHLLQIAGLTVALALLVGAAGWLLFERAAGDAERGVFVLGVLSLLAGVAAYLSLPPMLVGLIAGILWARMPGRADEIIRSDLEKLHPTLVVLLLVIAGATLELSRLAIWLLAPFVVFRLAGKLVAARLAGWVVPDLGTADLGARLLPCGLIGVALAIHFNQLVDGPLGAAVVGAVALGAMLFELATVFALAGFAGDR